jgi:hypothetical protein
LRDFCIWGRIDQVGPSQFFIVVSAVHDPPIEYDRTVVLTGEAKSRDDAEAARNELMRELGAKVRARGDRVVDVEES